MKTKICKNCGKKFKTKNDKQEDCNESCLADRFDKLSNKNRKIARIFAKTMGYQSMGEVRFKSLCNTNGIDVDYEVDTFDYQHKPQKYTVDFSSKKKRKKIYLEYKEK